METTIAVPRLELLQVADAVAREKGIERDEVLEAMEQAVQKAGRSKYGHEHDIRATIDRKIGDFLVDDLPPIDFGRIAAQTAKQVIVQKVRESERKRQFEEYKDRKSEIVNG